ncbi:hypothetical protein [Paracraurococcus lichenis]|uniref:Uncharacterized protein n=1 Tax=Paracraurococcus lichenis TaxID=3064888 RepID=A0ABT9ECC8_9PROT|nr:hypothetical protein [Paracraurococcus sp. LOR1-02]MDO9713759.1 hypothetical protein [Paracraurococcus sp. LOR1-02]
MTRQPADPWARFETPRTLVVIVTTTAALFGALGVWVGYDIGSTPPQQIAFQTGAIQIALPAEARQ